MVQPLKTVSYRIDAVQTPIIPVVADLILANPGTISLGQGVVHYLPPTEIANGVARFSNDQSHHYEAVEGIPELRQLISQKLKQENSIETDCYDVVISAGGNMGFLNAILAICDPGDEVILLSPWYFNHEMAIGIANCVAVSVDTDASFQPDLQAIEKAISPRTRAVVSVSPNNPTGAVYSKEHLTQINQICADHHIYHINDEAYEYFCYDGIEHFSPAALENAFDHTISLYSTSKSFALANWRIGYMLIPKYLFKPVRKIQDTNVICPPVISQFAAVECLKLGRDFCLEKRRGIETAREHFIHQLKTLPTISYPELAGAFYAFLQLPDLGMEDMDIVKYLIQKHRVAVIPGMAFGISDRQCLRVSYGALEPDKAVEGIDRLIEGLRELLANHP